MHVGVYEGAHEGEVFGWHIDYYRGHADHPMIGLTMDKDLEHDPRAASRRKTGFNWKSCLIESIIAIIVFDILAWIVTWYFILPRLKR